MKTEDMQLARAYVLIQPYSKPWSPQEGLEKGTIFADLYMPYKNQKTQNGVTKTFKGGVVIGEK